MQKIMKAILPLSRELLLELPPSAKILKVAGWGVPTETPGKLETAVAMFIEADPNGLCTQRTFRLLQTGDTMPIAEMKHIDSLFLEGMELHIFELLTPPISIVSARSSLPDISKN